MPDRSLFTILVIVLILLIGLGILALRARSTDRALFAGLGALSQTGEAPDLPAPIRAFAERNAPSRTGRVDVVRLTQAAEMRLKRGADWTGMTARQSIATGTTGFVWTATVPFGPIPKFQVIDAYVGGEGRLEVRLLGLLPIASQRGAETDRGEAMRYLAELPWAPDAILRNGDLVWTDLGQGRYEVATQAPGGRAAVVLIMNPGGDIVAMEAEDRPATDAEGAAVTLRWRGHFGPYVEIGGRRVPGSGEVGYLYGDGYEAYWRGTVTGYDATPNLPSE